MTTDETSLDIEHLRRWIGRRQVSFDRLTPRLAESFRATLDLPEGDLSEGAEAPPAIHWCLAPPIAATRDLGGDGHPARGGFLPPVALPRRMWVGGEIDFHAPLRIGDDVTLTSTVRNVTMKEGRSGRLCFVEVAHEIGTVRGPAISERQDIVYREASPAGVSAVPPAAADAPADPPVARRRAVGSVVLFRYSALTFNGHRIHYDPPYAKEVEGYPALVVHGPLQATFLLAEATSTFGRAPARFAYRARSPLLADAGCVVCVERTSERAATCWTRNDAGTICVSAEATW